MIMASGSTRFDAKDVQVLDLSYRVDDRVIYELQQVINERKGFGVPDGLAGRKASFFFID